MPTGLYFQVINGLAWGNGTKSEMRMKMNDKIFDSAFTMTEIVMTMTIIAFMGIVIAPKIADLVYAGDLKGDVKKIAVKLRELQQESTMKQQNSGIRFVNNTQCFETGVYDYLGIFTSTEYICLKNFTQLQLMYGSVSPHRMYFDRFGSPYKYNSVLPGFAAAECNIVVVDTRSGGQFVIEVSNVTGKVRIRT